MTDTSGPVGDDRRRLAELGATMLGPLLVRYVNEFTFAELTSPPDAPLSLEVLRLWRRNLLRAIGEDLTLLLAEEATEMWEARGLPSPSAATVNRAAILATRQTVADTGNIAQTLANAAAGKQGSAPLPDLLTPAHQAIVGASLIMTGMDRLYERYSTAEGLTGRRRWVTANPETSRHRDLHGTVAGPGEKFTIGDLDVRGPRADPADVEQWSNCSCTLEYETDEGDWR